jgi:VWFA-related protein
MNTITLILAAALLAAQTPAQTPVFKGGVKLVTLDVTVVDGDGKPVAGLTPADFTATINGAPARVQTLDFQQFGVDRIADAPAPALGAPLSAAAPATTTRSSRGPQTFLLLFDDLSFVPGAGKALQFAVERMLKQLDVSDLVGMTTTSGLESPVSPTRDRVALFAAIRRLTGRQADSADPYFISAQEISEIAVGLNDTLKTVILRECLGVAPGRPASRTQTDPGGSCADRVTAHARRLVSAAMRQKTDQLNALRHAIEAMSRAPAPRVIVFLSAGISVDATPQVRDAIEQLSALAARSGVQVYALLDEPDDINMRDDSELRVRARREEATFLLVRGCSRRWGRVQGDRTARSILLAHRV